MTAGTQQRPRRPEAARPRRGSPASNAPIAGQASAVMIGFLLQWPTIPTLVMFPIPVVVYAWLARAEEREVAAHFGQAWRDYAARTPGFVPRLRRRNSPGAPTRRAKISPRA